MSKMRLEIKGKEAHIYEVPWKYSVRLADGEESPRLITDFLKGSNVEGKLGEYKTTWYNCPFGWDEYSWQENEDIDTLFIHPEMPNRYE